MGAPVTNGKTSAGESADQVRVRKGRGDQLPWHQRQRAIAAAFLLMLPAGGALGWMMTDDDADTSGSGRVLLRFLNSQTGEAVIPKRMNVDGQEIEVEAERSGTLALTLSNGRRDIVVQAEGYHELTATVIVEGNETPVNELELDPVASDEQPAKLPPPDVAVLEGSVTDTDTGELLPGVTIEVPAPPSRAATNDKGHFELTLPFPGQEAAGTEPGMEKPRVTLQITKAGYQPEERRGVEVMPGDRRRYPIRLERVTDEASTSPRVTDESAPDWSTREYQWVYDVTLR